MTKKYFEKACGKISASIAIYGLTRTPVKEDGFVNYKSCIVISRMITMDWIAFIAFIAGIILVIIGIALLFNLPTTIIMSPTMIIIARQPAATAATLRHILYTFR